MPLTLAVMEPEDPAPAAASGALPKPLATEPGTVCTSCEKTRPLRGRLVTSRALSTSPNEELVVSTSGIAAVTVMDWAAEPTCSVSCTTVVLSTVTTFPLEMTVCRPGDATCTW
jgi:hypothetical protein